MPWSALHVDLFLFCLTVFCLFHICALYLYLKQHSPIIDFYNIWYLKDGRMCVEHLQLKSQDHSVICFAKSPFQCFSNIPCQAAGELHLSEYWPLCCTHWKRGENITTPWVILGSEITTGRWAKAAHFPPILLKYLISILNSAIMLFQYLHSFPHAETRQVIRFIYYDTSPQVEFH